MPATSWSVDDATLFSSSPVGVEEMRTLGAQLVTPELVIFPVRHHSPACAWQLRRLITNCAPSVVLVEGPRSFTSLIPQLTSLEARMPLAVYTYAVQRSTSEEQGARRAAYYPFCDYSPELVALREAQKCGIPARFIDLDFAEQSLIERDAGEQCESLLDERHYARSRHLQSLAKKLSCRDHEELWEHLFEIPTFSCSTNEHITRVASYCYLARLEYSEEELQAEGTLQREAEMAWHIQDALSHRAPEDGPVFAIVGGFHAVVLPKLLAASTKRPVISRESVSDEANALIRYSFDRLDRLNGYSAGMTSPAWHQRLWEIMSKHDKAGVKLSRKIRQDAALATIFDIAKDLRDKQALSLPLPTLSSAFEHVLQLATLRNRAAPAREDVLDAVLGCFVKGDIDADGLLIRAIAHQSFSGQSMGTVPAGASTPPLVKDFAYRARRQRLKIDDSSSHRALLELYRRSEHRVTSRLLHGLAFLGIPFAMRSAGPDFVNGMGLERMQEHWEYCHSAATESALIEASVYGVTVPLAVANRFSAKLDQMESEGRSRDARIAAQLLTQACVLGLHDHVPRIIAALHHAIGSETSFDSAVGAVGSIGLLWESREPLEARDISELPVLLKAAYERAVYLGNELRGIQTDGTPIVRSLLQLRELLVSKVGHALDGQLYWAMVHALYLNHESSLIRGASAGLLYSGGYLLETDLATSLNGNLNGMAQPSEAVAYLRGLLSSSREIAWQQPGVLSVLDELLQQWDEATFLTTLPELRLAFAEMTPKETDRIAEAIGQIHGGEDLGRLVQYDISAADVQKRLILSQAVRETLEADALQDWFAV